MSNVHRIVRFVAKNGQIYLGQRVSENCAAVIKGSLVGEHVLSDEVVEIAKLLCPTIPSQIMCVGLNYKLHAAEAKKDIPKFPVLFFKSVGSVQNPFDPILIPRVASKEPEVDFEGELAVVLGRPCKNVSVKEAKSYILGYTIGNDVSARRWQGAKGGSQWSRAKSFDTFCPLGPELVLPHALPGGNAGDLGIKTILNGSVMQDSRTSDMIFSIEELVSFLSQDTLLPANTVILTGTPQGVGYARNPPIFLSPGDTISVAIEGIGELTNRVEMAPTTFTPR